MKERAHAELIKQWADGCEIQYRKSGTDCWVDAPDPAWVSDYDYRIKPVEPAKQYPVTGMTDKELRDAYGYNDYQKPMVELANAALRHACDNGQIVTREEFDRITHDLKRAESSLKAAGYTDNGGQLWKPPLGNAYAERQARDLAVARAVLKECTSTAARWIGQPYQLHGIDLAAIIAEVK